MPRDARAYLWDELDAVQTIEQFVDGVDFSAYQASKLIQAAVERKFEIIDEA